MTADKPLNLGTHDETHDGMFVCEILVDGLVHDYRSLTWNTTKMWSLMCGRPIYWVESDDPRIVTAEINCVACLGNHPVHEHLRGWQMRFKVAGSWAM